MRVLSCLALQVSLIFSATIIPFGAPAADSPEIGYVRLLPDAGAPAPVGLAIFGYRTGGVLVTEAGVPSSGLIPTGRIFVDINGPVNTGIAIANPLNEDAVISYYFTNSTGQDFGNGSFTL